MSKDIEALIRSAQLPQDSVPVCLRADLVAEHERLTRELDKANKQPRTSLADGGTGQLAEQIRALEAEMQDSTVEFKLRAMPRPAWKAFVAAHPPRKDAEGKVDERDAYIGVNAETFFPAIVKRCTVAPELSDEVWQVLLDEKLTDRQFDELSNAAWRLNRGEVDVPFSRAAWREMDNSEAE